jgi:hypothetical protein
MTHDPNETERRLQAAAEQPSGSMDDDRVARYRYVLHAIRQLPVPAPPTGFARQMEAGLQDYPEDSLAEQCLLLIPAMAIAVLAAAIVAPWLATSVASLTLASMNIPWRFVMMLAGGLAGFAVVDALSTHQGRLH